MINQDIIENINRLASKGEDFLFVINYQGNSAYIRKLSDIDSSECLYDFGGKTNLPMHLSSNPALDACAASSKVSDFIWKVNAPQYAGLVTDTSFTNIAAYIDGKWLTPK